MSIVDQIVASPVGEGRSPDARSGASTEGAQARAVGGGPGGAALGTSRTSFPKSSAWAKDKTRRDRYIRRGQSSHWLIDQAIDQYESWAYRSDLGGYLDLATGEVLEDRPFVRPVRPARCSWRVEKTVGVHADAGHAHYSGTSRCASVWACPVCSAIIRAERAREIASAVEAHQASGGGVVFVTLTLRHQKSQRLADTLDAVLSGWSKLVAGRAYAGESAREFETRESLRQVREIQWSLDPDRMAARTRRRGPAKFRPRVRGLKETYGIQGFIRSTEITYGNSGWHPHAHVLMFTRDELTADQIQDLGDSIHRQWSRYAEKTTGLRPSRRHGVDVQSVDKNGQVLGQYLGKVQDEGKRWGVGLELARSDVKTGRGTSSFVPFEMLDEETGLPSAQRRRLWLEYVEVTRGRRAMSWSQGLRDRYGIDEREDEEIIEDAHQDTCRWIVEGKAYDRARRDPQRLARALECAETGDWQTLAVVLPGREPPVVNRLEDLFSATGSR